MDTVDVSIFETPREDAASFVPCLRLFAEPVLVEEGDGKYQERAIAVASLTFDYAGTRVPLAHRDGAEDFDVERNAVAEARCQRLLERHGAVEAECADGVIVDFDSEADYIVNIDGNVHAVCSFSAHAVPELREAGWQVEIAEDYPYQLVASEQPWYADVQTDDDDVDWFSLELGVQIGSERVNLLPALVELLDESPAESLSALAKHAARYRALPVGPHHYLALPWDRLERVLAVLVELYGGECGKNWRDPLPAASIDALGRLESTLRDQGSSVAWLGNRALIDRGRSLAQGPSHQPTPGSLRATLRPYQEQGLHWLGYLRDHDAAGVLADDMGLGKTLQTIALLCAEKEARRADRPTLLVLPKSLIGNWKRELSRFAPHLRVCTLCGSKRHALWDQAKRAEVVLTTYPLLIRDVERFEELPLHYLILDEAQAIKNPRSQAAQAVRKLEARHRLCLTGTPVENNLEELWALFDFLMPGHLGTREQFHVGFRQPIEGGGSDLRLAALRARVGPYVLRRLKETVARDLPPKTELVRSVELDGEQRDLYESIRVAAHGEVRQAIRKKGFGASSITILDALTKLRQVCCDPRLVRVDAAREVEGSAKLEMFFELLSRQLVEGRRVLVFSQFARMLALLSQGMEERGIRHGLLTGATENRQALVDAFQNEEIEVFLISLKAGGTGLNLTRADTVIHYDPWWNAAAQMQATDRAYRIGQTRPVFVYNLVVAGSVEERMLGLQQRKRHLAETLFGGSAERPNLSPDDIDDLFAPLPSAG